MAPWSQMGLPKISKIPVFCGGDFADSGKAAFMTISAAFLGYLYPAQFRIVSEFNSG